MKVTIIKRDRLCDFLISSSNKGSNWLTDFDNGKKYNLLNIELIDGKYYLISNNDAQVIDNKEVLIPKVVLQEYAFYLVRNNIKNEKCYVYCCPNIEDTYREFAITTDSISIGSGQNCEICFNMKGIPEKALSIEKVENQYIISVLNNSSAYLNGRRIINKEVLEYGDNLFMFGLKLVLMKHNSKDYLLVNNPNGLVAYSTLFSDVTKNASEFVEQNEQLSDESSGDNFFYRTPYFYKTINPCEIQIDAPPQKKEENEKSAILTIGPMITMSMTSVVMMMNSLNQLSNESANKSSVYGSLITCGAMLASSILWPLLTKTFEKRADKAYEKKRQNSYKKYIAKKEQEIQDALEEQRQMLINNTPSIKACIDNIKNHNTQLWQRRITDGDFLVISVGNGSIPMDLTIHYPEEHFSLAEDNLLEIAYDLGKKERMLNDVPIRYSLYESIATGVVGNQFITKAFVDRLILQIMSEYSYDEVKFVTLTSVDRETEWEYMKVLPHSWSDDKTLRYFGSSNDDYREIMYNLEMIYNARKQNNDVIKTHYVIVTDATKSIDTYDFIKNVMIDGKNYGFSVIMLVEKLTALPNECKNFINVSNGECNIFRTEITDNIQKFRVDLTPIGSLHDLAKELSNIPLDIKVETEETFPSVYQFLEMYQVGKVEQLNSIERWKKSNPILSLSVPVGVGKSKELINLDLHEKYHGPHGLIAGTTGSGKSEFILTYILSLAVNYSPKEVQMILIDYKGGSLAGAFVTGSYALPHIAGTITNLDGSELNRSLESIESEVKRRQREFNEARIIANESNIDIYKYQKLWREGRLENKDQISHLFIISDEFAELKEQQPEFMEKLISVARVGRSLGIHLILATQKPGGVVDSQIWSNTRFRVCLKVQDVSDSQEVIKKPDAAYLKKTGRFYLQVGYDEVFTLGQAAWAGGQYFPRSYYQKNFDTSVNEINNIGFVTTSKNVEKQEKVKSEGEELPNVVKYLAEIAKEEGIVPRKLWLDKIPDKIYIDNLKEKYAFVKEDFVLNPIIGEYDDPETQTQSALTVPFSKNGNVIIYGMTGAGKEGFISSLIYSIETSYTPQEVNFYIFDFASEILKMFSGSPYIADVTYIGDEEKILNFFRFIETEIQNRKKLLSSYGGSYNSYAKANHNLPNYIVIFNGYENLEESYFDLVNEMVQITRDAAKYGIYFVLTVSSANGVKSRLQQNFNLNYVLQQTNEFDYTTILGNVQKKYPAKIKGRGLIKKDRVYEFQTARVTEEDLNQFIINHCNDLKAKYDYKPRRIPVLPEVVDYNFIKDSITQSSKVVIGVNKETLAIESYDLKKTSINLVCGLDLESTLSFTKNFINVITCAKYYSPVLLNSMDTDFTNVLPNEQIITKKFEDAFVSACNYIDKAYEIFKSHDYNEESISKIQHVAYVLYGASLIMNKMSADVKKIFAESLKKNNEMGIITFIFVDSVELLKGYTFEEWFKNGCDQTRGLWIGSGVAEQSLIKIAKIDPEYRKDIPNDLGYIVNNSRINCVKLITNWHENK